MERAYKNHLAQLPDLFRAKEKLKHIDEGIILKPPDTDKHEASTIFLGSLFQYLTSLTIKRNFSGFQTQPFLLTEARSC